MIGCYFYLWCFGNFGWCARIFLLALPTGFGWEWRTKVITNYVEIQDTSLQKLEGRFLITSWPFRLVGHDHEIQYSSTSQEHLSVITRWFIQQRFYKRVLLVFWRCVSGKCLTMVFWQWCLLNICNVLTVITPPGSGVDHLTSSVEFKTLHQEQGS